MKEQADEQNIINAAKEDKSGFAALYEVYESKIKSYLMSKVNYDKFIADDLSSITFEKAFKNIKTYKWQGISFSAWIYKIANNTLIDYYRASSKNKFASNTDDINIKDPSQNIEDIATNFDSSSRIKNLLNQLNNKEKEVIMLKFYEGYTNKLIAEKLKMTETNVSTIVYRSIQKLRKSTSLERYI